MADTPPPRSGKGFSLSNPGAKEYVIVGLIAVAVGYLYFRNKAATAATAAATPTAAGTPVVLAGNSGGGVPFGAFFAWIQNHQSSPAPAPPTHHKRPPPPEPPKQPDKGKQQQDHGGQKQGDQQQGSH
jgi:hypothetical protein